MFALSKSKESNFNMTFGGENEILIEDLIYSLDGFSNLLSIVTSTLEPEAKVELKFKKSSAGSFDVEFVILIIGSFISLLNSLEEPIKVVNLLIEFLNLRKFLGGKPPATIKTVDDCVIVENMNGGIININPIVLRINDHPLTDSNVKKMFETNRETIEISTKKGDSFKAHKSDYSVLTSEISLDTPVIEVRDSCNRVILQIKKPDLLGNSMWEFMYREKTIKAVINDDDFLARLQHGSVSINSHTFLEVDLKSTSEIDEIGEVLSIKYDIIKVYRLNTENISEQSTFLDE